MTTKNTTQHTPGPWEVAETPRYGAHFITNATGKMSIANSVSGPTAQEAAANAALIAAAPELLGALLQAESTVMRLGGKLTDLAPIRAAIAKATGDTEGGRL